MIRSSTVVKKAMNVVKNRKATNKANQGTIKDNSYVSQRTKTGPFTYMIRRKRRANADAARKQRVSKPLPKNPHSKASLTAKRKANKK